jgi:hypothetical protein
MNVRLHAPWLMAVLCGVCAGVRAAETPAPAPTPAPALYEETGWRTPETQIDRLVFRALGSMGVQPDPCSDAVFIRRAFLDVIGTLPSANEVREFLKNQDPDKRTALIDRLLAREEYADYWAMRWSDILRIKAEFPVNLWPNAAQAYHRWVRASVRDNKPYDRFVWELLTSNGSNFRVGPVNFYRAMQDRTPEGIARTVALTFMGTRADSWPPGVVSNMAVFFSQVSYKPTREWKEEIVFWDPDRETKDAGTNAVPDAASPKKIALAQPVRPYVRTGVLPDGTRVKLPADRDPRELFAQWLISPDNSWFTASVVNRQWAWLLGRGIVHEPDDVRKDNPPSNPALLSHLRKEFVASRYDLKKLQRSILTSRTYQVSSIPPRASGPEVEANFAFYPLRQLDAEVLIDAICRITRTTELYTSAIPEPFTFIPETKPAIALPDGSITSAFLELFGRPARATGMENERVNRASPSQRMHLLNSTHIQRKIEESPVLRAVAAPSRKPAEITEDLYLMILSRFPTAEETARVQAYMKAGVARGREVWIDLVWALFNSDEFRYRH